MTVAAWDGRFLAADRMAAVDGWKFEETKLFLLPDGSAFVGAGHAEVVREVRNWLAGESEKPTNMPSDGFVAIHVRSDGSAWSLESRLVPMPIEGHYAIGSGEKFAVTVMHLGGAAPEAVLVANELCSGADFGVDYVDCKDPDQWFLLTTQVRSSNGLGLETDHDKWLGAGDPR